MPLFLVHTSKWWPCDMWPADLVTSRPFDNTLAAITFQIFIEVCMSDTFCIKIISRKRNYPQLLEINMWKWWPCDIGCNFSQTDLWIKFELVMVFANHLKQKWKVYATLFGTYFKMMTLWPTDLVTLAAITDSDIFCVKIVSRKNYVVLYFIYYIYKNDDLVTCWLCDNGFNNY